MTVTVSRVCSMRRTHAPAGSGNDYPRPSTKPAESRRRRSSTRSQCPGSDEPAQLQAELAALEEQLPALELAYDIVARDLHGLRRGQQHKWREEQTRAVAKARWLVEEEGGRKKPAEEESLLA